MDHSEFQTRLRKAYADAALISRQIKLPAPDRIRISGDLSTTTIHLSRAAVLTNMQEDAAAFEGWALVLMAWCGVERVRLDWDEPDGNAQAADPGHYQRFLYRMRHFADLLGAERVMICREDRLDRLRVGPGKQAVLNVASQCRIAPYGDAPTDWRSLNENQLECWLTAPNSPPRQRLVAALGLRQLDRQFPVGVFAETVTTPNRIFPSARSAIDILGIDEDRTLWLLELKAGSNAKVGALSELLLYSAIMHDMLTDRRHWRFHAPASSAITDIRPDDVLTCQRIEARLLTPPIHPLLDPETAPGRRVFELLNESAVRKGWKIGYGTLDLRPIFDDQQASPASLRRGSTQAWAVAGKVALR